MNQAKPIVIAAGGTGGHIFPALAVASELRKRSVPVIWVGTRNGLEARLVPEAKFEIRWISIEGVRGKGFLGLLASPFRIAKASLQSLRILLGIGPGAVLGMGGFVSGPVGLAALLTRKPLVLHEQNAFAGTTNRLLSRFATKVFAAFPSALKQADVVGNPVRDSFASINSTSADRSSALNVLIVGGSRGARVLNENVPPAIAMLKEASVNVWHQTGIADQLAVRQRYDAASRDARVDAFIDDMAAAYEWADLVICRSGAMTVSEIAAVGVASVLVPFPHATDDHQTYNARYLSDVSAAILMPQSELNAQTLSMTLNKLIENRPMLDDMAKAAARQYKADATKKVADALQAVSR
jgi:UDP-N-acetylglucosamine--N-acetylmuramyl-(pentapeptide) pyrophosphoryl-undecaprenol N-acetylglucosamine transferase